MSHCDLGGRPLVSVESQGRPTRRQIQTPGGANPAAPAARDLGNCRGTGEIVPLANRTFEWGGVIAKFIVRFECRASPLCPASFTQNRGKIAPAARQGRLERRKRQPTLVDLHLTEYLCGGMGMATGALRNAVRHILQYHIHVRFAIGAEKTDEPSPAVGAR